MTIDAGSLMDAGIFDCRSVAWKRRVARASVCEPLGSVHRFITPLGLIVGRSKVRALRYGLGQRCRN